MPKLSAEGVDLAAGRQFWSFRPVSDPALPQVRDPSWVRNDIDRFVLARMESEGLQPVGDADSLTLLRRVAFDLTGLPPTPHDVESFAADSLPGAYGRVVERLAQLTPVR